MGQVMFDRYQFRPHRRGIDLTGLCYLVDDAQITPRSAEVLRCSTQTGDWMSKHITGFRLTIGTGVVRDCHEIQIRHAQSTCTENGSDGRGRKGGIVFQPSPQALFSDRRNQFPIDHDRRGCIGMIDIQS